MFKLIDPAVARDHSTASAILCDITRLLALAFSHPDMGEGCSDREGARHMMGALADCIGDLDTLAAMERDRAREDGYQRGLKEAPTGSTSIPQLTEPAPQSGRRQRTA